MRIEIPFAPVLDLHRLGRVLWRRVVWFFPGAGFGGIVADVGAGVHGEERHGGCHCGGQQISLANIP